MKEVVLETERLLLRFPRESDFEEYAKICADPEVMRFLGGQPMTELEAWRHMAFVIGHWYFRGYGQWVVEEKASGRLVGRIGFTNPAGWPGFELGWTLGRESWGKGFASEVARHSPRVTFAPAYRSQVPAQFEPENIRSIKV